MDNPANATAARRARRAGIAIASLAILALFVPCLINAMYWIDRPFAGFLALENGIVVSMGREAWVRPERRRAHWTQIVAVDGARVDGGPALHARIQKLGIGTPVRYTFRDGADDFQLAFDVRRFQRRDFFEVFGPMLLVGILVAGAGAVVAWWRPEAPAALALFVLSVGLGCTLITSPDLYAPGWFTPVFYLALCLVAPALVQLTLSYPRPSGILRRGRWVYAALYGPFLGLGAAILGVMSEPRLFLALLYSVYFFSANAILLYIGRLVLALIDGVRPLRPVLLALFAIASSSLPAVAILVTYPLLERPVSPILMLGPLLLMPTITGIAIAGSARSAGPVPPRPWSAAAPQPSGSSPSGVSFD